MEKLSEERVVKTTGRVSQEDMLTQDSHGDVKEAAIPCNDVQDLPDGPTLKPYQMYLIRKINNRVVELNPTKSSVSTSFFYSKLVNDVPVGQSPKLVHLREDLSAVGRRQKGHTRTKCVLRNHEHWISTIPDDTEGAHLDVDGL